MRPIKLLSLLAACTMLAACNDEEEFTCRLQSFEISAVTTTTATLTAVIDASDMEAVDQMGFCVRRTSDVDFEWIAIPKSRTIICRLDDLAEGATYECRAFVRAVGESWTFPVERFTTQKGGGSDPDPDPNPDPDPDPTPDPDPDPNPDPDPDPTPDPDGPVYRTGCRSRTMPTATAATTRTRPTTMRIICAQATSRMHRTTARHAISAYVTAASTTVRYGSQHRVTNAIRARQTAPTHTAKTRRYRPIYSITASLRAEDATRDTWWVRPNALRRRRPTVRCSTTRT